MTGFVEGIFVAPEGGAQMKGVAVSNALEGGGLEGDRYCAASEGFVKSPSSQPRMSTISNERPACV